MGFNTTQLCSFRKLPGTAGYANFLPQAQYALYNCTGVAVQMQNMKLLISDANSSRLWMEFALSPGMCRLKPAIDQHGPMEGNMWFPPLKCPPRYEAFIHTSKYAGTLRLVCSNLPVSCEE